MLSPIFWCRGKSIVPYQMADNKEVLMSCYPKRQLHEGQLDFTQDMSSIRNIPEGSQEGTCRVTVTVKRRTGQKSPRNLTLVIRCWKPWGTTSMRILSKDVSVTRGVLVEDWYARWIQWRWTSRLRRSKCGQNPPAGWFYRVGWTE